MKRSVLALVDCNNFFVSAERVYDPSLRARPVAVLSNNDGCVISRSNEAKALGIPMGAPAFKYRDLFGRHKVVVLSSSFGRYGEMSQRVMETLATFTPAVEVYSVDEAFLDISDLPINDYDDFGRVIAARVGQWTGIPVAVGIGATKTLAKAAAELAKQYPRLNNSLCFMSASPDAWLARLPASDIWGIGRRLAPRLAARGITTALGFRDAQEHWIRSHFTVSTQRVWEELNGINCFGLTSQRSAKQSISVTRSFGEARTKLYELERAVASFANRAAYNLRRQGSVTGALSVFIQTGKHGRGPRYNRSIRVTLAEDTAFTPALTEAALSGLAAIYEPGFRYKRAGILLTDIKPRAQANLLAPTSETEIRRQERLSRAIDRATKRWGRRALHLAAEGTGLNIFKTRDRTWSDLPAVKA